MEDTEGYKFFEHTADAKFRAYGKTMEDRFANAALAMFSLIIDIKEIKPEIEKQVEVKGNDQKQLLYNWLEEILFLLDADSFFLNSIKSMEITQKGRYYTLKAVVAGDTFKDEYLVYGSVKAVTYAEMEIEKAYIPVVVDI